MTVSHPVAPATPSLPLAQMLREHFSSRPSLEEVAAHVLQRALAQRYGWLPITPAKPLLLEPVYRYTADGFTSVGFDRSTLVDALIERFVTGHSVDYSQGQILTNSPPGSPAVPLAVNHQDLEWAVNQWGPQLINAYQEALVSYWMRPHDNGLSRFRWLAGQLKQTLLSTAVHSTALTSRQLEMIRQVVLIPDNVLRALSHGVKAYIVDQWGVSGSETLEMLRGIVLYERMETGDTLILFTLSGGIKVFASYPELGAQLLSLFSALTPQQRMQWRLYEPGGNIFESFSLTFLAKQLRDIQDAAPQAQQFERPGHVLERALKVATVDFDSVTIRGNTSLAKLRQALPAWLVMADPDRQQVMSQLLQDLAKSLQAPRWKPFDEDIPDIRRFARQALMAQMARDYPTKPVLDPDLIKVTLKLNLTQDLPTIGLFWKVPWGYTESTQTLTELSLRSLTAVDAELASISADQGVDATWLTYEVVRDLIYAVNVGKTYPELVSQQLRDDATQVAWRKARFVEQVRLQLPMLALENSLRYPGAFSQRAFEYVACVFKADVAQRSVDGQVIVLRPLAFKLRAGATPDVVLNMFLIGPQDISAGSLVLFRPMASVKLIEFSSLTALFDAIADPGRLQYDVLAWMSESARTRYTRQGFRAPHISVLNVIDFAQSLWSPSSALIDDRVVTGDYLEFLYQSTVDALLTLADQQSVSNLQAFWTWVKLKGGMSLSALLPLVGGPAGQVLRWLAPAWLAVQDLQGIEQGDTPDKMLGVADLLMNIAMLLLNAGNALRKVGPVVQLDTLLDQAQGLIGDEREIEFSWHEEGDSLLGGGTQSHSSSSTTQLDTVQSTSSLVREQPVLEQPWDGLYRRLSAIRQAEIELFRISRPLNVRRIDAGRTRGLYRNDAGLYAQVAEDWYAVEDSGSRVLAVDTEHPFRKGPELISDGVGGWSFLPEDQPPENTLMRRYSQRAEQLAQDALRRTALEAEYLKLFQEFTDEQLSDDSLIKALSGGEGDFAAQEQLIVEQLARMETAAWRSGKLLEFLKARRRLQVIKGFSDLHNRFSAGKVLAWRNQVELLSSKRRILLQQDVFEAKVFDVMQLPAVVGDVKLFATLSKRLPQYSELQTKAIALCSDAEQTLEHMQAQGRIGDTTMQGLTSSDWAGRRMSFKWRELQLRTLALQCFEPGDVRINHVAFDLINEVNQLASLRLMTCVELFSSHRFTLEQELRVLNGAFDGLVVADYKLTNQLNALPSYINRKALDSYHAFVRSLKARVEEQLLEHYGDFDAAGTVAGNGGRPLSTTVMLATRLRGLLIGKRRNAAEGESTELEYADLLEPFDHRVVMSFKRFLDDPQGDWSQIAARETGPVTKSAYGLLIGANAEAVRLVSLAPDKLQEAARMALFSQVSPLELRMDMLRYVQKMHRQREVLVEAMAAPGMLERHPEDYASAQETMRRLEAQVGHFIGEAVRRRNAMALARPPSSEGLLLLFDAGVIEVEEVKLGLRPEQRRGGELLRYFEVREASSGAVLWVAHFHYANVLARNAGYQFSRGHLKPFARRSISYGKLKQQALTDEERLNVYRMNLDHGIAGKVFFDPLADQ